MFKIGKRVKLKDNPIEGFIVNNESIAWVRAKCNLETAYLESVYGEIKSNDFILLDILSLKDYLTSFRSPESGKIVDNATFQDVFLVLMKNNLNQIVCTISDEIEQSLSDEEIADSIKQIFSDSVEIT